MNVLLLHAYLSHRMPLIKTQHLPGYRVSFLVLL